jgi:Flp pilus assembly protein TadD
LAQLALRKNDLEEAERTAEALITTQPNSPAGYNVRAVVKSRRGDMPGAEADLRKAMELAPRDPLAYTRLAEVRTVQKKFKDAETLYEQALGINPEFTEALASLLTTYTLEKKPANEVISRLKTQIGRAPNNTAYYVMLGEAFIRVRDLENSQAALEKAVELDGKNVRAYVLLADVQAARGSLPQGISTAERAVQLSPRDLRAYSVLGSLEDRSGNWQKAEDTFRKAMQIDPAYGIGANKLAYLLLEHGGNVDEALSFAQTARNSIPDSPATADTLAWAYVQKGLYGSAFDLLKKALAQAPGDPNIHYHLGVAYQKSGNMAAAATEYRQVLKLDPAYAKGPEIRKILADPNAQ